MKTEWMEWLFVWEARDLLKKEGEAEDVTNPIIAHFRRKVGIRFPDPLGIVEQVGGWKWILE